MNTVFASTFKKAHCRLTIDEQRLVHDLKVQLDMDVIRPGQNREKLGGADSNMYSMRVNDGIRLILGFQGNNAVLCYVGHHDDAYDWAARRKLQINEDTGSPQLVVIDEKTIEVIRRKVVEQEPESEAAPRTRRPFAHLSLTQLGRLAVPKQWCAIVKDASMETFLDELGDNLPEEAVEYLLDVAMGQTPKLPAKVVGRDPFEHPDAKRHFHIMNVDDGALRLALSEPWEDWEVFLHPAQQDAVERRHSGPARVSGGPGTGKTVVAVHRAARLAREGRGRVLLTSFSKTLAERLQEQACSLLSLEPEALARLDVQHLHSVAVRTYNGHSERPFKAPQGRQFDELLERAWNEAGGGGQTLAFAEAEWEMIVDPHDVRDLETYKVVACTTRATPLGPQARERLWPVFGRLRELLAEAGLTSWSGMCWRAAAGLAGPERPYTHVVADEVQDFGPAELSLLRALAPEGPDDVFLAGDGYQRIYQPRSSFVAAGLEVRGRSSVLRLNYRTTEEIRRATDALVARRTSDDPEDEPGALSLMTGPKPNYKTFGTVSNERTAVADWIRNLVSNGYRPSEIAVLARTRELLDDRVKPAVRAANCSYTDLEGGGGSGGGAGGVAIGTMHRSKGMQFRAVVVMGVEEGTVPLDKVLKRQPDEPARRAFLEGERNLLYVACTRVRERLLVTGVGERSGFLRTANVGM